MKLDCGCKVPFFRGLIMKSVLAVGAWPLFDYLHGDIKL